MSKELVPMKPREVLIENEKRHSFTGIIRRADGITVEATIHVPEGHPMGLPSRSRIGEDANFLECGEIAMMAAQRSYQLVISNEHSRAHWDARYAEDAAAEAGES